MRIGWLALLVVACATPDKLQTGTCGNGVVDPGEDCEYFPALDAGAGATCAQPGSAHECHFVCDPTNTATAQCPTGFACAMDGVCASVSNTCGNGIVEAGEDCESTLDNNGATCAPPGAANACHYTCGSASCPAGYGCGADGRCRQPTGNFIEAKDSPFIGQDEFVAVADFNGDHVLDVVTGNTFNGAQIAFGAAARDGTFPTTTPFPVQYTGQLGIGDFDGDGRADLAMDGLPGLTIMRGEPDDTLVSVTSPTFFPQSVSDTVDQDFEIPMHPDASSPFEEILHVSVVSDHVLIAFDQFNSLTQQLTPDPTPITIAGAHTPFFTLFNSFAMPQQFPVADLNKTPATGGDEVAIAFLGETVVKIFTATFTAGPGTGLPATLTAEHDITGWPGPLESPPQLVDINGDGFLDVAAIVNDNSAACSVAGGSPHLVFSAGNGHGIYAAPIVQCQFDPFLGFGAADPQGDFLLANLAGDARADVVSFETNEVLTATGSAGAPDFALAGFLANGCVFIDECEVVTPDLNRDGLRDVVMTSQDGLAVGYNGASGVFDNAFVLTPGTPFNLRTGDFDGDRVDDVMFTIADSVTGETSLFVLYGTTSGVPATPAKIATWPNLQGAEPAVLGLDQIPSSFDTTNDVVTVSAEGSADRFPGAIEGTLLFGDASRSLLSILGLVIATPAVVPGRFASGATSTSALLPLQGTDGAGTVFNQYAEWTFPVDGSDPVERDILVDAFEDSTTFDVTDCTQFAHGDIDGDGAEDVVAVQACDPSGIGTGPSAASLLVISTIATEVTATPVALPISQGGVARISLVDVDGDGHLDVLAVFGGDSESCGTTFPCANSSSGVVVLYGDGTGAFPTTAVLPPVAAAGQALDAVALNTDGDPELELAVAYQTGVVIYDQGDHAFTAAPQAAFLLQSSAALVAAGDLDGDGVTDLLVDDSGTVHVLLGQPVAH